MLIVKIPGINGLGKTNGCENAGNLIIENLKNIRTNESGKPIDKKLLNLEEIHLNNNDVEKSNELIYKNSLKMYGEQDKIIFLGGDHSISYSTGSGFLTYCKKQRKKPVLIVFDAHSDLMEPMKEPTHEEWLRALIEKKKFPVENILLIGARNIYFQEREFLSKNKIKQITVNNLNQNIQDVCDMIMEFAYGEDGNNKEVYVSLDIDVIDSAFAPATGYREPGGLTARQMIYLLQRINKIKNLKAVDIVEINPEKDKNFDNMTIKLGSKILAELL